MKDFKRLIEWLIYQLEAFMHSTRFKKLLIPILALATIDSHTFPFQLNFESDSDQYIHICPSTFTRAGQPM